MRITKNETGLCAVTGCANDFVEGLVFVGRVPAQMENTRMPADLEFVAKVCREHYKLLTPGVIHPGSFSL